MLDIVSVFIMYMRVSCNNFQLFDRHFPFPLTHFTIFKGVKLKFSLSRNNAKIFMYLYLYFPSVFLARNLFNFFVVVAVTVFYIIVLFLRSLERKYKCIFSCSCCCCCSL